MATLQENIDAMDLAFSTHMKNKNPGVDTATIQNIEDFSLAYATAIANAIGAGSSGDTGVSGDYVKKTGGADGVMAGSLSANFGFKAGWNATNQIDTTINGLMLNGAIDHQTGVFKGHGKELIEHSSLWVNINGNDEFTSGVTLGGAETKVKTRLLVGQSPSTGLVADGSILNYKNFAIYHAGNSNKSDVNWSMRDAVVSATLSVSGISSFTGGVSANSGFSAGVSGAKSLEVLADGVNIYNDIILSSNKGIKSGFNNDYILKDFNDGNVGVSAAGENIILGYSNTKKITLSTDIYNNNGSRLLIDKFGVGSFLWGFNAGYEGNKWFETTQLGAQVNGKLFFNDTNSYIQEGAGNSMRFSTAHGYVDIGPKNTAYAHIETDRGKFFFNKNTETNGTVGIYNSETHLANGKLFLTASNYLLNTTDGIAHYGNSYIKGSIGTSSFSTGFSGNGWQITQNAEATFTDLTVRNKLHVYEFEVQKITAVNGSFWVSANCSGSTVTKL